MNIIKNEKGVALVLAMIMIVLMSILGAFALSTSTTEIAISGNYRNSQDAFYAADSAVEYAATNGAIYTAIGTSTTPQDLNLSPYKENLSIDNNGRVSSLVDTANVSTVTYLGDGGGSLPAGFIYDADVGGGYKANYFLITVTTTGPSGSQANIETQIAKLVPKS